MKLFRREKLVKKTPYDPVCETYARDMKYLDPFLQDGQSREDFIREEEGTYNSRTGHFLCDGCYIRVGTPSTPRGWVCP